METLHILEQSEFQILAAAVGITDLYGIEPGEPLSEKDVMYHIHEMVQKGLLSEQEKGFSIDENIKTALLFLKNTKKILAVTGSGQGMENTCFYIGEKVITLEESLRDKNAIRIGVYDKDMLFSLLSEKGFLPKPFVEMDIAVLQPQEELLETLSEDTQKGLFETAQFELLKEEVLIQYLVFAYGADREPLAVKGLYLLLNPCNYWIAEKDREETVFLQYDESSMYERILAALQ